MWLEALESTYHNLFGIEVLIFIELVVYFITRAGPDPAPPKPPA